MAAYKWKRGKSRRAANALGLTKAGFLSYKAGTALALAERSPGGISRQASKLTRQAYAPAEAMLSQQETRVKSLQAKRDADNAAFAQWVASRGDQLRAAAVASNAATQARLAQGQQEFNTQLANIRQSAQAQATTQQSPGGIGGADAANLAANQAAASAGTQNATNQATAHAGRSQEALDATLANNAAVVAADRARDFAASLKELEGVADDRQKLALDRAGSQAQLVQKMMQDEITKAQAAIAAGQFQQKEANDLFDASQGRGVTKRGQDKTRQTAKDKLAADKTKVNKYGFSNQQWERFSPSHRRRLIKQGGKSGSESQKSSPAYKKAHAKAISQLNNAVDYGKGVTAVPAAEGQDAPKPPKFGPHNVKPLIDWLISIGSDPAVARMAALKIVYPKLKVDRKTAPETYRRWVTYINSLTGSR